MTMWYGNPESKNCMRVSRKLKDGRVVLRTKYGTDTRAYKPDELERSQWRPYQRKPDWADRSRV